MVLHYCRWYRIVSIDEQELRFMRTYCAPQTRLHTVVLAVQIRDVPVRRLVDRATDEPCLKFVFRVYGFNTF
jgi:hypothetical protein